MSFCLCAPRRRTIPEGLTSISQSDGCNHSRGFKVRVQWTRAGIGVYHGLARKSYDWWGFSTYLKEGTTTHPRFFFSICCDVQQTSQAMGLLVGLSVTLLSNSRCGRCMELLKQRRSEGKTRCTPIVACMCCSCQGRYPGSSRA